MPDSPHPPSALMFALLIGTAPELTQAFVTEGYRAAEAAWRRRDDVVVGTVQAQLRDSVVQDRSLIEDGSDDDLSRALSAPVDGRDIVRPIGGVDTGGLSVAVQRFLILEDRLPDLGTWRDRQVVWNRLSGRRPARTPITNRHAQNGAAR